MAAGLGGSADGKPDVLKHLTYIEDRGLIIEHLNFISDAANDKVERNRAMQHVARSYEVWSPACTDIE